MDFTVYTCILACRFEAEKDHIYLSAIYVCSPIKSYNQLIQSIQAFEKKNEAFNSFHVSRQKIISRRSFLVPRKKGCFAQYLMSSSSNNRRN